MNSQTDNSLKQAVYNYWNKASCGTDVTQQQKHSKHYFEEIEAARYAAEADIFSFTQFTRYHGKKMLEVGVGAGSDFVQWVRAGTQAHGIDLTQEAIDNVTHRLQVYGLQAQELRVADAENLPYSDASFDLVYSWGVIHHSPNTIKCLEEIIRVTKPGGTIKIMVYNRHSLFAVDRYLLYALIKGRPFQTLTSVIFNHQESVGTKAYTFKEIRTIIARYPVTLVDLKAPVAQRDLQFPSPGPILRAPWFVLRTLAYVATCCLGWNRLGWFMMIELRKN